MNLRRTIATLLAALMLLALTACGAGTTSPAQDANAPAEETAPSTTESSQFRVGMECAYAPSNWQESAATDTNVPVENVAGAYAEGYDVQIARILADQLGKELVIVKLSWDGLIDALNQGQNDAIIARLQQGTCDAIVINEESAPGYLASNPDFRLITFSEGNGFTLPAKGSCVGLRKSDTELLAQINEILATIDSDARTEMWNTAVANQPK